MLRFIRRSGVLDEDVAFGEAFILLFYFVFYVRTMGGELFFKNKTEKWWSKQEGKEWNRGQEEES